MNSCIFRNFQWKKSSNSKLSKLIRLDLFICLSAFMFRDVVCLYVILKIIVGMFCQNLPTFWSILEKRHIKCQKGDEHILGENLYSCYFQTRICERMSFEESDTFFANLSCFSQNTKKYWIFPHILQKLTQRKLFQLIRHPMFSKLKINIFCL